MRPSSRSPEDLTAKIGSVLGTVQDARPVLAALARTLRANIPQQREHPSHEVLLDDWAHAFAMAQNRRPTHPLKQGVLDVARRLDDAGLGRLRLGRRGKKTRFSLPPAELSSWLAALEQTPTDDDAPFRLTLEQAPEPATPALRPEPSPSESTRPSPAPAMPRSPPSAASAPSDRRVAHRFVVRPGVVVEFELPEDFSAPEAKRLATFVTALPFDA